LELAHTQQQELVNEAVHEVNETLHRHSRNDKIIFAATDSPTHGILGLVANRIRAEHNLPTLLFSRSGNDYIGTTRSVRGFDLNKVVTEFSSITENAGGHPEAGAVKVKPGNLYKLREAVTSSAEKDLTKEQLQSIISYECELSLRHITEDMYHTLEEIGPFGRGNERPVFLTRNTNMSIQRIFGDEDQHIELTFQKKGSREVRAVAFNMAKRVIDLAFTGKTVDVLYSIPLDQEDSTNGMMEVKSLRTGNQTQVKVARKITKTAEDYGYGENI
jgi:single-stranded-DNA-specific exonuclease